jgi:DNA-directed RNA polymerase subunit N (RpoN/RPB10)
LTFWAGEPQGNRERHREWLESRVQRGIHFRRVERRDSTLRPWAYAAEGVLGRGHAVRAAQKFSFSCIGLLVAEFALGAAFDTSPELARVFEVHLSAGIAKHRGRGLLSVEESTAVLAGLGLERYARRRDLMIRKHWGRQNMNNRSSCRLFKTSGSLSASHVAGAEAPATMWDTSRKNC